MISFPGSATIPLKTLLRNSECTKKVQVNGNEFLAVNRLLADYHDAGPSDIMVALDYDGKDPLPEVLLAIANGCKLVLTRKPLPLDDTITQLVAADFGLVLGRLSAAIQGNPANCLKVFVVTGTNGKSTSTFFFHQLMRNAGQPYGLIGSLAYELGDVCLPSWKTTPYPHDLHALFAQIRNAGLHGVALEASSAGLMMDRLLSTPISVAAFTNLTVDHRIHHPTLEDYFAAKLRLFIDPKQASAPRHAVINTDDEWGRKLYKRVRSVSETLSYGLQHTADVHVRAIQPLHDTDSSRGVRFELHSPWGQFQVQLPLPGSFNIYNALTAFTAGVLLGADAEQAARFLSQLRLPEGRLQEIPNQCGFRVFVDYAHSVDALVKVGSELRNLTSARLIVVFGCGGMRGCIPEEIGQAAASYADCCIITTQDPGPMSAEALASRVALGVPPGVEFHLIADRQQAIQFALDQAQSGDVVLLAGKGHEKVQIIGSRHFPHDEIAITQSALAQLSSTYSRL